MKAKTFCHNIIYKKKIVIKLATLFAITYYQNTHTTKFQNRSTS